MYNPYTNNGSHKDTKIVCVVYYKLIGIGGIGCLKEWWTDQLYMLQVNKPRRNGSMSIRS